MKRREVLAGLAAGAVVPATGCLSPGSYTCLPLSRMDLVILSDIHSQQRVEVTIRTRWLGRTVFSETVDVPPATDTGARTTVPDAVMNPGTYRVAVTLGATTYTGVWSTKCRALTIRLRDRDEVYLDGRLLTAP